MPLRGTRARTVKLVAAVFAVAGCAADKKPSGPVLSPDTNYDFGQVVQGKTIEYAYTIRGDTAKDLRISRVAGCVGCDVTAVDSAVPRGGSARVRVRLDTKNFRGPFNQIAHVFFTDTTRRPIPLRLKGHVVWPVEFTPLSHANFFTAKGQGGRQEIVMQNNEAQPLVISSVTSSSPVFLPVIQTLEQGRKFKLIITLDTAAPVGKHDARINLATNNPRFPTLSLRSFAQVRSTVALAPPRVSYGLTAFRSINRIAVRSREIRVIKAGSKDFSVTRATVDLPFMTVETRPLKPGESIIVTVRIDPKKAKKGEFKGTLIIETNDAQYPTFRVPVTGNLV